MNIELTDCQLDMALHNMGTKFPRESKIWLRRFFVEAQLAVANYPDDDFHNNHHALASKNNWNVSQEIIDASDNLKSRNAINISKIKDMPNG
jgi:hypothetical protein